MTLYEYARKVGLPKGQPTMTQRKKLARQSLLDRMRASFMRSAKGMATIVPRGLDLALYESLGQPAPISDIAEGTEALERIRQAYLTSPPRSFLEKAAEVVPGAIPTTAAALGTAAAAGLLTGSPVVGGLAGASVIAPISAGATYHAAREAGAHPDVALQAAKATSALEALLEYYGASTILKGLAGRGIAAQLLRNPVLRSAAIEGLEEISQAASERGIARATYAPPPPGKAGEVFAQDVGEALWEGLAGAIVGGGIGGIAGLASRPRTPEELPTRVTEPPVVTPPSPPPGAPGKPAVSPREEEAITRQRIKEVAKVVEKQAKQEEKIAKAAHSLRAGDEILSPPDAQGNRRKATVIDVKGNGVDIRLTTPEGESRVYFLSTEELEKRLANGYEVIPGANLPVAQRANAGQPPPVEVTVEKPPKLPVEAPVDPSTVPQVEAVTKADELIEEMKAEGKSEQHIRQVIETLVVKKPETLSQLEIQLMNKPEYKKILDARRARFWEANKDKLEVLPSGKTVAEWMLSRGLGYKYFNDPDTGQKALSLSTGDAFALLVARGGGKGLRYEEPLEGVAAALEEEDVEGLEEAPVEVETPEPTWEEVEPTEEAIFAEYAKSTIFEQTEIGRLTAKYPNKGKIKTITFGVVDLSSDPTKQTPIPTKLPQDIVKKRDMRKYKGPVKLVSQRIDVLRGDLHPDDEMLFTPVKYATPGRSRVILKAVDAKYGDSDIEIPPVPVAAFGNEEELAQFEKHYNKVLEENAKAATVRKAQYQRKAVWPRLPGVRQNRAYYFGDTDHVTKEDIAGLVRHHPRFGIILEMPPRNRIVGVIATPQQFAKAVRLYGETTDKGKEYVKEGKQKKLEKWVATEIFNQWYENQRNYYKDNVNLGILQPSREQDIETQFQLLPTLNWLHPMDQELYTRLVEEYNIPPREVIKYISKEGKEVSPIVYKEYVKTAKSVLENIKNGKITAFTRAGKKWQELPIGVIIGFVDENTVVPARVTRIVSIPRLRQSKPKTWLREAAKAEGKSAKDYQAYLNKLVSVPVGPDKETLQERTVQIHFEVIPEEERPIRVVEQAQATREDIKERLQKEQMRYRSELFRRQQKRRPSPPPTERKEIPVTPPLPSAFLSPQAAAGHTSLSYPFKPHRGGEEAKVDLLRFYTVITKNNVYDKALLLGETVVRGKPHIVVLVGEERVTIPYADIKKMALIRPRVTAGIPEYRISPEGDIEELETEEALDKDWEVVDTYTPATLDKEKLKDAVKVIQAREATPPTPFTYKETYYEQVGEGVPFEKFGFPIGEDYIVRYINNEGLSVVTPPKYRIELADITSDGFVFEYEKPDGLYRLIIPIERVEKIATIQKYEFQVKEGRFKPVIGKNLANELAALKKNIPLVKPAVTPAAPKTEKRAEPKQKQKKPVTPKAPEKKVINRKVTPTTKREVSPEERFNSLVDALVAGEEPAVEITEPLVETKKPVEETVTEPLEKEIPPKGKSIRIPFTEWSRKQIVKGKKTATSRSKPLGKPGDVFTVDGEKFVITSVEKKSLRDVAINHYQEEGVSSREEFIKLWKSIYNYFDADKEVFFHKFAKVRQTRKESTPVSTHLRFPGTYGKGPIKSLLPFQVFVFDSNTKGIHGAGAAKRALKFGAAKGVAEGLQGQTYAITTKTSPHGKAVPPDSIGVQLRKLFTYAEDHPQMEFLFADMELPEDAVSLIASMYAQNKIPPNVVFSDKMGNKIYNMAVDMLKEAPPESGAILPPRVVELLKRIEPLPLHMRPAVPPEPPQRPPVTPPPEGEPSPPPKKGRKKGLTEEERERATMLDEIVEKQSKLKAWLIEEKELFGKLLFAAKTKYRARVELGKRRAEHLVALHFTDPETVDKILRLNPFWKPEQAAAFAARIAEATRRHPLLKVATPEEREQAMLLAQGIKHVKELDEQGDEPLLPNEFYYEYTDNVTRETRTVIVGLGTRGRINVPQDLPPELTDVELMGQLQVPEQEARRRWEEASERARRAAVAYAGAAKDEFNHNVLRGMFNYADNFEGYVSMLVKEDTPRYGSIWVYPQHRWRVMPRRAPMQRLKRSMDLDRTVVDLAVQAEAAIQAAYKTHANNLSGAELERLASLPVRKDVPLRDGYTEFRGMFGKNRGKRLQTPHAVYDAYIATLHQQAEAMDFLQTLSTVESIVVGNMLTHTSTLTTNAIGQIIIATAGLLENFYNYSFQKILFGLGLTKTPPVDTVTPVIKGILYTMHPLWVQRYSSASWGEQRQMEELYGRFGPRGERGTPIHWLSRKIGNVNTTLLLPFRLIDTQAKRASWIYSAIMYAGEEGAKKLTAEDIINLPMEEYAKFLDEMDKRALDYTNEPRWTARLKHTPGGRLVLPLPTYPVKYLFHMLRYLHALNPKAPLTGVERAAKLATLFTMLYCFAALIKPGRDRLKRGYIGPIRGVTSGMNIPAFSPSGRFRLAEGLYMRGTKYPYANIVLGTEALSKYIGGYFSKNYIAQTQGAEELRQLSYEGIIPGPIWQALFIYTGARTDYQRYTPSSALWGELAKQLIPLYRVSESTKRIMYKERRKPETFLDALMKGVPFVPPMGKKPTTGPLEYDRDIELLAMLYGINLKKIPPAEFEAERQRVLQNIAYNVATGKAPKKGMRVLREAGITKEEIPRLLRERRMRLAASRRR